jgi:peptide/nickel transport system permease protein
MTVDRVETAERKERVSPVPPRDASHKLRLRQDSAGRFALTNAIRVCQHLFLFFARRRLSLFAILLMAAWTVILAGAPWIAPYSPNVQDITNRLQPPSAVHLFGTDEFGRDVLSRVIYGGRVSVLAGFNVVLLSAILGTFIGSLAGYWGNWLDDVLMRTTDVFFAFPPITLALAIGAALGPELYRSIIAIIIVWWPQYARMARGAVQSLKGREYVLAARSIGNSDGRILWRTVLPNAMTPIFVLGFLDLSNGVVVVAIFSFLGLGVQPPTPEWGAMIASGASLVEKWWISFFPGIAMASIVMALNLLGDVARDYLDPRLRRVMRS